MSKDQMFFGQSPADQRSGFQAANGEGGYYVIKYAQDPGGAEGMGDDGSQMESMRAGAGRAHAGAPAFTFSRRSRPKWVPPSEQLAPGSPTAAASKASGKGGKPGSSGLASGLTRPPNDVRLQVSPEAARPKR